MTQQICTKKRTHAELTIIAHTKDYKMDHKIDHQMKKRLEELMNVLVLDLGKVMLLKASEE